MTDRILSQHGNVIAADFRQQRLVDISVTLTSETLFCDGHVTLICTIASIDGTPAVVTHTRRPRHRENDQPLTTRNRPWN